jgi:hypothetical protein
MTAWLKKALGYVLVAVGLVALALVLLMAIAPSARAWVGQALAGAGWIGAIIAAMLGIKRIQRDREGRGEPKTKTDILADDPQHSLDRLPDNLRAGLDAGIKSDVDAQVGAIFDRQRRDGGADPGAADGGPAGG